MKNILYTILLLSVAISLQAQQLPSFTHNLYQPEFYNPARIGDGFLGVNYRDQWANSDIKEDTPVSYLLVADLSNFLNIERVGIGLQLVGDNIHFMNSTSVGGSFAYQIIEATDQRLTAAINANFLSQSADFTERRIENLSDPALANSTRGTAFHAGFGLHYHINFDDIQHLNLDFALPQLFATPLKYEGGELQTLLRPHLRLRASYLYDAGDFGIEPILAYSNFLADETLMTDKTIGGIDFGTRIHLLDGIFWVGGNFRPTRDALNGSIFGFSAGVRPTDELQGMASFELGSIFGNTMEFGVLYSFGAVSTDKDIIKARRNSDTDRKNTENHRINIESELVKITNAMKDMSDNSIPDYVKIERVKAARKALERGKGSLLAYEKNKNNIAEDKRKADGIAQAKPKQGNTKDYQSLAKNESETRIEYQRLERELKAMETRVTKAEQKYIIQPLAMLREAKIREVQAYLQKELDELDDKPNNMEAVEVKQLGQSYIISYTYANTQKAYMTDQQDNVEALLQHIQSKINQLSTEGLNISATNIRLIANLKEKTRRWKYDASNYKGQYGSSLTINCKKVDLSFTNPSPVPYPVSVKSGEISLDELAALKLYGIRAYLRGEGINANYELQMRGPNDRQDYSQNYTIEIEIR